MNSAVTIYLVRHGQVENPGEIFYGRLPGCPGSEAGRAQEAAAAGYLKDRPISAIYSSPQLRARQTAAIIGNEFSPALPLHVTPLLNEIRSPYDGRSQEEMSARGWDFYTEAGTGYEQPQDVLERLLTFIKQVRRERGGQEVVGVTHADPLAFLWLWIFGRPASVENRKRLDEFGLADDYPATASVSKLVFEENEDGERPRFEYVRPY
jgi:broad specificity phosphatase PhoE